MYKCPTKSKDLTKKDIYNILCNWDVVYAKNIYAYLLDEGILDLYDFMLWSKLKGYISGAQYAEYLKVDANAGEEIFSSYDTTYALIPYAQACYCDPSKQDCIYKLSDLKIKSILATYFSEIGSLKADIYNFFLLKDGSLNQFLLDSINENVKCENDLGSFEILEALDLEYIKQKAKREAEL